MEFVFVESANSIDVTNISTVSQETTYIKAYLENPVIDVSKMEGYVLTENVNGYVLTFDEEKYNDFIREKEKEEAIKMGEAMKEQLQEEYILSIATDKEAYTMRYLYEEWAPDTDYITGDRRLYKDNLYKCKQDHTSQKEHTPDLIPALWDIINGDPEKGTKENPIIIPDEVSSMVYVKGKYYSEDGVLYLMNREGMEDGEEISLTFKPSQLIGHYFEKVE